MARKYDHEYKVQAVKLAKEIGGAKTAKELGIPEGTIHTWLKAVKAGKLDVGEGSHTPASAMSLSEEITMLRKRVKEQDKVSSGKLNDAPIGRLFAAFSVGASGVRCFICGLLVTFFVIEKIPADYLRGSCIIHAGYGHRAPQRSLQHRFHLKQRRSGLYSIQYQKARITHIRYPSMGCKDTFRWSIGQG